MFRQTGKFRNLFPVPYPRELCYDDLRTADSAIADTNPIATSGQYLAVLWQSSAGGCICPIELKKTGRLSPSGVPLIHAHAGKIASLQFSSFDDCLLASSGDEGSVKLWKLPEDGLAESMSQAAVVVAEAGPRVQEIQFHSCSKEILAGACQNAVKVWDLNNPQDRVVSLPEHGDTVYSIGWSYDGTLIASTCKDKEIRLLDPRSNVVAAQITGHQGNKPSRICWLGRSDKFISTGFGLTREREILFWDSKNLNAPYKRILLDSSPGVLFPAFDADTNVLYISGKGDSSIKTYEVFDEAPFLQDIHQFVSESPHRGFALLPKRALNVMDCEVMRVLRVMNTSVDAIKFEVPRKMKRFFQEDLFPPTLKPESVLTADQWFNNENRVPELMSLSYMDGGSQQCNVPQSPKSPAVEVKSAGLEVPQEASNPRRSVNLFQINRRHSKYKHMFATPFKKELTYIHLKPSQHLVDTNAIICNKKFFAVPYAGGGGPVVVVNIANIGRVSPTPPFLNGHSSFITDFAFSPCDDHLLATGGDDSIVNVWKIPEQGVTETITQSAYRYNQHERRLSTVNFHPLVQNLLITTSYDNTLRLLDFEQQNERRVIRNAHADIVTSVCVSYEGDRLATVCKDGFVRMFDPRAPEAEVERTQGKQDRAQVVWLGNSQRLLTVGHSRLERQFSIWDVRNMAEPMLTQSIDSAPGAVLPHFDEDTGLLYLAGKGDANFRIYELFNEAPYQEYITEVQSSTPQIGFAPLPKSMLDVRDVEVGRFLKLTANSVEPYKVNVPRAKLQFFQDDLFPPTRSNECISSVDDWFDGNDPDPRGPKLTSLQPPDMAPLSSAPKAEPKMLPSVSILQAKEREDKEKRDRELVLQGFSNMAQTKATGGNKNRWDAARPQEDDQSDHEEGWDD